MSSRMRLRNGISAQIETLESRLAMSAEGLSGLLGGAVEPHAFNGPPPLDQHLLADDAVQLSHHDLTSPDFWITEEERRTQAEQLNGIEQFLWEAHQLTGWHQVQTEYGFSGAGQTVAVIDSGLAYDHYALGGGLGSGYRVVGGWDFTEENDSDPYDDGPSGSHGTHVGGIIGGSDPTHTGVAPDVDLVGLRVFNDEGEGWFSWVESALDWVHEHRNDFDNPITAINLSLGVSSWNAETIPTWASLEDEFAQLEADGIFIAVSAGNSYASYNEAGLSYPAASSYVVPVMSVDQDGQLSYFSQRHSRAIAAPGRSIVSTVPDYNGDGNGATDDFRGKSGTSMAAPYVAGASVLVREAMEFVGMTDITQDLIYDHLRDTADDFVDEASGRWYKRLNLHEAIDVLMPEDDFGSTMQAAYDLGSLSGSMAMSGHIASLGDMDYFTFTAGMTGNVTFDASHLTNDLAAAWQVYGAPLLSTLSGGSGVSFAVQAGQQYSVSFASSAGLGFYDFEISTESAFAYADWGAVAQEQFNDVAVDGEGWHRVEATRDGILTAQGFFDPTSGSVELELYDENLQMLASGGSTSNGAVRVDVDVDAGQALFLRLVGRNADVDVQITNLVDIDAGVVTAVGTDAADDFLLAAGATPTLSINSVSYAFDVGQASQIRLDGGAGNDALTLVGSAAEEAFVFRVGSATLSDAGGTHMVEAAAFENQIAHAGSHADVVHFHDSLGDDTLTTTTTTAQLEGNGFLHAASGFSQVQALATTGWDRAFMHDGQGDDTYEARHDTSRLHGEGFDHRATGFVRVFAFATEGLDRAFFYDTAGDDVFEGRDRYSRMFGDDYYNLANRFDRVFAHATEGTDRAFLWDTTGDDTFESRPRHSRMFGDAYYNCVSKFDRVFAHASEGWDRAFFWDTEGDDTFEGRRDSSRMYGDQFYSYAQSFDRTFAYASDGWDRAFLYDSPGNDVFEATPTFARIMGEGYYNYTVRFDRVIGFSQNGGQDMMALTGSAGDDVLESSSLGTRLFGDGFYAYGHGFQEVRAESGPGGDDRADVTDLTADAVLTGIGDQAVCRNSGRDLEMRGFEFGRFEAVDGQSPIEMLGAVDYLFELVGDWQ